MEKEKFKNKMKEQSLVLKIKNVSEADKSYNFT